MIKEKTFTEDVEDSKSTENDEVFNPLKDLLGK